MTKELAEMEELPAQIEIKEKRRGDSDKLRRKGIINELYLLMASLIAALSWLILYRSCLIFVIIGPLFICYVIITERRASNITRIILEKIDPYIRDKDSETIRKALRNKVWKNDMFLLLIIGIIFMIFFITMFSYYLFGIRKLLYEPHDTIFYFLSLFCIVITHFFIRPRPLDPINISGIALDPLTNLTLPTVIWVTIFIFYLSGLATILITVLLLIHIIIDT